MKVLCAPHNALPSPIPKDTICVMLNDRSHSSEVGSVGCSIIEKLAKQKLTPSLKALDFLSIALSVISTDSAILRSNSSDGWTRELELTVYLTEPEYWITQINILENALKYLTGDIWKLNFIGGRQSTELNDNPKILLEDSVCLLSGGMDSLVGAIDLVNKRMKPVFVSQLNRGDRDNQQLFAQHVSKESHHFQFNHNVNVPVKHYENSQRSRSLVFIAYGVIICSCLTQYQNFNKVKLFIPENGFISLNPPLTNLRLGSLSTRTTHPYFIDIIQNLLNNAQLLITLENPYQFQTKGEMLENCMDQLLLHENVFTSVSCGRYSRTGYQHCGRCVPCLVRRAAINHWKEADKTKYKYNDLNIPDRKHKYFDDVMSISMCVEQVRLNKLDAWLSGILNTAQLSEYGKLKSVIERGLQELEMYLIKSGIL